MFFKKIYFVFLLVILVGCGGGDSNTGGGDSSAELVINLGSSCSGRGPFELLINSVLVTRLSAGQTFRDNFDVGDKITIEFRNPNTEDNSRTITIGTNGFTLNQGCSGGAMQPQPQPQPQPSQPTTAELVIRLEASCSGRGTFELLLNNVLVARLSAGQTFRRTFTIGSKVTVEFRNDNIQDNSQTITIGSNGFILNQGCSGGGMQPNPTSEQPNPTSGQPVQPAQIRNARTVGVFASGEQCLAGGQNAVYWDQRLSFTVVNPNSFGINYFYRVSLDGGASTNGSGTIFNGGGTSSVTSRVNLGCFVFQPPSKQGEIVIRQTTRN